MKITSLPQPPPLLPPPCTIELNSEEIIILRGLIGHTSPSMLSNLLLKDISTVRHNRYKSITNNAHLVSKFIDGLYRLLKTHCAETDKE